jgi:16S rRNA (cytidine1402-2'-O)-methyltransferase
MTPSPRLVLVATPIGNLGDLSPRSIETLAAAELICCEDTRRTGRLLQAAGVRGKRLAVCNEHTERRCVDEVLTVLASGGDVAVVTDAGTPGISDPGELLVRGVLDAGFEVSTVPGPAALVAALVSSGLPTNRFVFEGFLPRTGSERRRRLAEIADERRTVILYEAPHRIARTIADLTEACGPDRPVAVARELTKLYETIVRGTLGKVDLSDPRGEYVIVLGGAADATTEVSDDTIVAAIEAELAAGMSGRDAATRVAAALGVARRRAYDIANARPKRR